MEDEESLEVEVEDIMCDQRIISTTEWDLESSSTLRFSTT